MARLTVGQKANRVLRLLLSLRNPRITAPLVEHGFTPEDLDEGWSRLRALADGRLDRLLPPAGAPPALAVLDAWENKWFPIARATLERHHPRAAELVFRNLSQTDGAQVVIGVGTFLSRVRALDTAPELGPDGATARALLATRGLTDATLGEAQALVEQLAGFADLTPPPDTEEPAAIREAEDALWSWYLEWSAIARTVISDRRLLRSMGFLRYRPSTGRLEEVPDDDEVEFEEVDVTEEGEEGGDASPELRADAGAVAAG